MDSVEIRSTEGYFFVGFVCIVNISITEVNSFITPGGTCDILLLSPECFVHPAAVPQDEDRGVWRCALNTMTTHGYSL